jgi:DNA-directed RNA polymerase specialized sigma24 family protein
MISDGIENCLQYIDNFDPSKSQNPFAYFTQIIYYAFLRRIQKEKKYLYTKYVAIERANLLDETSEVQESDKRSGSRFNDDVSYGEWSQEQMERFMNSFDENRKSKKEKRKKAIDNDVTNSI